MLTESTPIEKLIIGLVLALMIVIAISIYGELITKSFNQTAQKIERTRQWQR